MALTSEALSRAERVTHRSLSLPKCLCQVHLSVQRWGFAHSSSTWQENMISSWKKKQSLFEKKHIFNSVCTL